MAVAARLSIWEHGTGEIVLRRSVHAWKVVKYDPDDPDDVDGVYFALQTDAANDNTPFGVGLVLSDEALGTLGYSRETPDPLTVEPTDEELLQRGWVRLSMGLFEEEDE